ncbi:MAG: hypothetical protein E7534_03600 [Ruminococcaceae bacterium]|nr:hypothetical protein [Oscillospiraceae bacterium]
MAIFTVEKIVSTEKETDQVWYGLYVRSQDGREWCCEAVTTSLQETEEFAQALRESDIEEYHLESLLEDWVTEQYLLE